jgi:hypothetical protein
VIFGESLQTALSRESAKIDFMVSPLGQTAVVRLQSLRTVTTTAYSAAADFIHVDYPEPHGRRTRQLLAAHPEVRQLFGSTPSAFLWILALIAFQIVASFAVAGSPWWVILLVAYIVGTTG